MKPGDLITPANASAHRALKPTGFPHMGPLDARVWRLALSSGLVKADKFEYDVRLGGAGAHLVEDAHPHKGMWLTLLRKRVDVIAWTGDQATVIEVKPVGSFAALGQALAYAWLYKKEQRPKLPPIAAVCCAVVDPDLRPIFAAFGVQVLELPLALAQEGLGDSVHVPTAPGT